MTDYGTHGQAHNAGVIMGQRCERVPRGQALKLYPSLSQATAGDQGCGEANAEDRHVRIPASHLSEQVLHLVDPLPRGEAKHGEERKIGDEDPLVAGTPANGQGFIGQLLGVIEPALQVRQVRVEQRDLPAEVWILRVLDDTLVDVDLGAKARYVAEL